MVKFCGNRYLAVLLMSVLFFLSCGDADLFDTDKWSSEMEGWTPGVKVQVVHGEFTLWDLINQGEDGVISKDGNELSISYTEEDIYVMPVERIFKMPEVGTDFTVVLPDLDLPTGVLQSATTLPDIPLTAEFPDIPEGCELTELIISGRLTCTFPYAGFAYKAQVEFENIEQNGTSFSITKDITENETVDSWDLNHASFNLAKTNTLRLKLIVYLEAGTVIENSNALDILKLQLTSLKFEEAEGKINVDPIEIDPGSFDMDVDFLNEISGDFKFTKPELSLEIHNKGVGVPVKIKDIKFKNQDSVLQLNVGQSLDFAGNKDNTSAKPEVQFLNSANSNIVEFLSMPPSGDIAYSGTILVNPEGSDDNKIYGDGEIRIDARVRIPFSLSANELTYCDTLNDIDIDAKVADKITEGSLWIKAENGLPLSLNIPELLLLGENNQVLTTVLNTNHNVIKAGKGDGTLTSSEPIEFGLNKEQAKLLGQTKNILLKAIANTNNEPVDITADAKLKFSLSMEVKARINDYDDF